MNTENTAQHTPGPWSCYFNPITGKGSVSIDPLGSCKPLLNKPINAGDARLIAASPELLEACIALMKAEPMQTLGKRDGGTLGQISSAIDLARAAIAKATGGVRC